VVGQAGTVFYFLFFVVLIPAIGTLEAKLLLINKTETKTPLLANL